MPVVKSVDRMLNPPFDDRMRNIGHPASTKGIKRGRIVLAQPHPATKKRHAIRFMYNPIALQVSHPFDGNLVDPSQLGMKDLGTTYGPLANAGRTSVDLYFDRTYETWDAHYASEDVGMYGVYVDVLAFYQMLGITPIEKLGPLVKNKMGGGYEGDFGPGRQSFSSDLWRSHYPQGPVRQTMVYMYLGDKLRYYGYISDLNVSYTHFTQAMVPNRCYLSVGLSLLPDPTLKPPNQKANNRPTPKQTKGPLGTVGVPERVQEVFPGAFGGNKKP